MAEQAQAYVVMNFAFLAVLQFLHIYWYGLFIKIIIHKVRTGKAEDLQSQQKRE
jgi:hypothetical protein